jgi:RNA polymerase sporulation-specific sigma factor
LLKARRKVQTAEKGYINPLIGSQEEMIERNMGLLKKISTKWWLRVKHIGRTEFDDLFQEAAIGMLAAYHSYHYDKVSFNTFAVPTAYRYVQMYVDYRMQLVHVPVKKKRLSLVAAKIISTNTKLDDDSEEEFQDSLKATPTDFTVPEVEEFLNGLTHTERKSVEMLMLGYSYGEIGKVLGCTKQAINSKIKNVRTKYLFYQANGRHKRWGEKETEVPQRRKPNASKTNGRSVETNSQRQMA